MTVKYKRVPKAKPGQLIVTWAHRKCDGPDLYFINGGSGATQWDRALANYAFCAPRIRFVYGEEAAKIGSDTDFEPSFVEELEKRGYDLTTLRFSIQKKAAE
jgi:hypothetical protein